MRRSLSAFVLVTALLSAAAARAQLPQTPGSGVSLTGCDPRPHNNAVESGFRVTPYKTGQRAILAVQYANLAPSAATAVVFGLVSSGKLVGVGEDEGTFSPDALVSHELMLTQEIFPLGAETHCVVLAVRYSNGTAWYNPTSPAP
jgi:hypothetical protein